MTMLLSIAVALFAGLLMSRVVKLLKLPAVTGYLIAGLLIGPFVLGRLQIPGFGFGSLDEVDHLKPISEVALGFIAFAIGNEFRLSQLRVIGKKATVIAVFQALSATLLVDLLLPIVALDDAVGLIVFAISFGIAKTFTSGAALSIVSVLVNPLLEVVASVALGSLLGSIYTYVERFFHSRSKRLCVAITFVIMEVSLSMLDFKFPGSELELGFSSLLVCMMLGTIFCNICPSSEELMAKTDRWTAPLFVLFFVISGAELDLSVFSDVTCVLIGIVYIVFRSAGKIFGAGISSKFMKCEPLVQKWLGFTLLPQAGVALGMSITVAELGSEGAIIRSIVLFSVLIYELVGPMLTKIALTKAGEIHPKEAAK